MNYFICYDISDDKIRTRLSKMLEREGLHRVQKSIFFAKGFKPWEINAVATKIALLTQETGEGDSVLLLPIERDQLASLILIGENEAIDKVLNAPPIRFF